MGNGAALLYTAALNFPCARISKKAFLQYFDFYNFRRYYQFMA
jgi:hypothetical protein